MKISAEEVKKIALLSRLEFAPERVEAVEKQLSDSLSYMELIEQANIENIEPTAHAVALSNVMRDDVPHESLSNEKALQNAPEAENGYFKVPKVIQD